MPRTALRRTLTTLVVLAGSTGLAACGDDEEPTQVRNVPAQEAPAPAPETGASTDDEAPAPRSATAGDDDRDDRDDRDDDRDERDDDRDERDDR
jgi:hypothetical protein